jgi:hypothetical protein
MPRCAPIPVTWLSRGPVMEGKRGASGRAMKQGLLPGISISRVMGSMLLGLAAVTWAAVASAAYDMSWNSIAGGGATFIAGGNYSLGTTIGQEASGPSNGANYSLNAGFWQTTATTLLLQSVASRKVHGLAGTFDLGLGLVPTNPTTEPRSGGAGGSHTIVFTFNQPLTGGTAAVSAGTAVAGVPTFSGSEMIVPLSGVANQQYVTVVASSVTSSGGGTGSGSVRIGFLLGDVNQSRVVSVADLGLVNALLAQVVTAANYLKDVNGSGTLTVADKGVTNANLTKALPAP